jgi:monovalent cation:H+ antiporter-2, CPA2 family
MHHAGLVKDLALLLALASVLSVLLRWLRLPGALGYLLAGWLAGTHGPGGGFVHGNSVQGMAEIGIVLLFFTMGAEFQLSRLKEAGLAALMAASAGMLTLVFVGSSLGRSFGWGRIDSIFLGALLSISSTVMVVRTLKEGGYGHKAFAKLAQAILVAEDILAVALLAILAGAASGKGTDALAIAGTFGRMSAFLVLAGGIGILIMPRLLQAVVRIAGEEALLLAALAMAFSFCLLMEFVGFSAALGAFLAGALLAGSPLAPALSARIEPLRDLFSALFFISMGMLIIPLEIWKNLWLILAAAGLVLFLKPLACALGALLSGSTARTAMRSGLSLGQIGEFSMVIAALGTALKVTRPELHAVAIGVTLVTALLSPALLSQQRGLNKMAASIIPSVIQQGIRSYGDWVTGKTGLTWRRMAAQMVRKLLIQTLLNSALVGGLFFCSSFLTVADAFAGHSTLIWLVALGLSLPFFLAIYRKLRALAMLLAEIAFPLSRPRSERPRKVMTELIPWLGLFLLHLWILALSGDMAPSAAIQALAIGIGGLLSWWLWKPFTRIQSRLRAAWADAIG